MFTLVYTDEIAGGWAMAEDIRSLINGQKEKPLQTQVSDTLLDSYHLISAHNINNIIVLWMLCAPPPTYLEKVPAALVPATAS